MTLSAVQAKTTIDNARRDGLKGKAPRPLHGGRRCHCGGWQLTNKVVGVALVGTQPVETNPCSSGNCKERFTRFLPLTQETRQRF